VHQTLVLIVQSTVQHVQVVLFVTHVSPDLRYKQTKHVHALLHNILQLLTQHVLLFSLLQLDSTTMDKT
jgi:hypothetical protein